MVSRRGFGSSVIGSVLGAGTAGGATPAASGPALQALHGNPPPAGEVVLFPFDDVSVPLRYRLKLGLVNRTNPYKPHPKVLIKGDPGEPDADATAFNGAMLQVGGELRLWYLGSDRPGKWHVCYATSKDGMKFDKPKLGLKEFNGSKQNNLVDIPIDTAPTLSMLYEPEDPDPKRRFKMVYEVSPYEIGAAYSPDGLHWTLSKNNPILKHNSIEPGGLIKHSGCYYLNGQGGNAGTKRSLVTFLSYDFEHWSDAVVVGLRRDQWPHLDVPGIHAGEQIHLGAGLWDRGNVIIGFYGQWHGATNDRHTVAIDIGMAVSNDAMHFREPVPNFQVVSASEIFPSVHQPSMVPAAAINAGQAFANVGDQTLFYYGPWYGGFICVASWPRDRLGYFEMVTKQKPNVFVQQDTHSLDLKGEAPPEVKYAVNFTDPHFISCPLQLGDGEVSVAVNVEGLSEQSQLRVELLDEQFRPLPGYSGADCVPLTKAGLRQPVVWRNRKVVESIKRPVRVKVRWGGARPEDTYVYAVYLSGTQ
jgi:hypothetical protein